MKKIFSSLLVLLMLSALLLSCGTDDGITRGTTTDTAYINESIGIRFTLPEGWQFYSEEMIAQIANISQEMLKDPNLFELTPSVIDFMAIDAATGIDNINLAVENLKASGNAQKTEDEYISDFKTMIVEQMPDATYTFGETETAMLGTSQFKKLVAACNYGGVDMTQYLYIRKIGHHIIAISATTATGMSAAEFEAMFS